MKILVPTAGPVPAKEKADYIVNIAKMIEAEKNQQVPSLWGQAEERLLLNG